MRLWTTAVACGLSLVLTGASLAQQAPAPPAPPAAAPAAGADFAQLIGLLQQYIDLVEGFDRLADDPGACGVAAVIGAKQLLAPQGGEASIKYFNDLLPEVKHPAVQRAIRLQLVELYKESGQQDQALAQLRHLIITAAP